MLSSTLTISHESYCFARNIFPVSESKKVTAALETEQDPSHPVALVSWLQSFPASGSFPMSQFFQSDGQSCWSFSFSISPSINVHGWFSLELTDLISLLSKGLKKVFSSTTVWEHQFFGPQHSHLCSFPDGSEGKESVRNAGDPGSIPWSERYSGEGNGNPLQNLAGESHRQRSLVGYSPWGHRELGRTEELTLSLPFSHSLTWLVGKPALTIRTFVDKLMALLFNMPVGCKQESLRRNWVAIIVNKSLKCSTWMQSQKWLNDICLFPRQTIQYHSNPSLCPNQLHWRSWGWTVLWRPTRPSRTNTPLKKMSFL